MSTIISFAVTDFHNQTCKVLGIRDESEFQFEYKDSPAPFTKDTVLLFHAHVWPLINHTNIGTVRFTFVLPDTSEKTGVLENFSVDCIQRYHEEKVARGQGEHLAQFSVRIESE
jgi:hypothetical protein